MVAGVTTPSMHPPETTIEPQSCCGAPIRIGTLRMLELDGPGGLPIVQRVRAYCAGCRVVVYPRGVEGLVPLETIALDRKQVAWTAPVGPIGRFGTASTLGLPRWPELGAHVPVVKIERSDLWNDYEVLAHSKNDRRDRMRGLAGLTRKRALRDIPTVVENLPALVIGIRTINHLLDESVPHRQGADHLRFWPIIAKLARNPLEAWKLPIAAGSHQHYALLTTFHVGGTIRNHLTLVNDYGRIVTAYALSNIKGAERARRGTLLHLGYEI